MAQSPLNYSSKLPSNALAPTILGKQSDLLTSSLHGSKYHQAYTNALFWGANPSAVTTSAGLATTYVGLCLSNPAGNTVNLVLRRVAGFNIVVPSAFTVFGLITGYSAAGVVTHTTALTALGSSLINGTAPTGKLDSACTIVGTPVFSSYFGASPTATTTGSFAVELDGAFVIPPGGYAAIGTSVAGATSAFLGSMEWEEVAV
jgi:hypothetical protein